MKKIWFMFMIIMPCAYSAKLSMGNPFSFEVDGVKFDEQTTSDEKAQWGELVSKGQDPLKAARFVLSQRKKS